MIKKYTRKASFLQHVVNNRILLLVHVKTCSSFQTKKHVEFEKKMVKLTREKHQCLQHFVNNRVCFCSFQAYASPCLNQIPGISKCVASADQAAHPRATKYSHMQSGDILLQEDKPSSNRAGGMFRILFILCRTAANRR